MDKIGRYRVIRRLGEGGMGAVYLAFDPSLQREVAIKLLHDAGQAGLREEARAIAAMRHPGIVRVYEIGEHDNRDFIAMEYLPGRSLRQVMLAGLPRGELLEVFGNIVSAVAAAHGARVLHRDLKPENVIVNDALDVVVVDFGLARRMDHTTGKIQAQVTAAEIAVAFRNTTAPDAGPRTMDTIAESWVSIAGTPSYMAPEVLCGHRSTEASDVYSLGVMVYELVAGRRPYEANNLVGLIAQMIDEPPAPIDDPLADLVLRMLAREPEVRPSLGEIAAALRARASGIASAVMTASMTPGTGFPLLESSQSALPAPPAALHAIERTATPRPRSRLVWLAVGALVLGGGFGVAYLTVRGRSRPARTSNPGVPGPTPAHTAVTKSGRDRMVDWGSLSPDGSRIAFSDPTGLYVQDITTNSRRSYPFPSSHPRLVAWYPDGETLLVTACSSATECSLSSVAVDSGRVTLVRADASGGAISPDGESFAYYAPDRRVVIEPVAGGERKRLGTAVAYAREPPVWSPDSRMIAYLTRGDAGAATGVPATSDYTIVVQPIDGDAHAIVTSARLSLADERFAIAFLPDGSLLYGQSNPLDQPNGTTLTVQPLLDSGAPDGAARVLTTFPGTSLSHLSVAPTGDRIAALATATQGDIYVATLGDKRDKRRFVATEVRLTRDDRDDRGASWLDRDTVLFTSDRKGRFGVYSEKLDGTSIRELVDEPMLATWPLLRRGPHPEVLYWSTPATTAGASALRAMTLDPTAPPSGKTREILPAQATTPYTQGGRPPPLGLTLSCAAGTTDEPTSDARCVTSARLERDVQFRDLDGHELAAITLATTPGENWDWALRRDGRAVAFPDGPDLRIVDLVSGEITTRSSVPGARWHCVTWDVDGEGLFATGILPGEREFQLAYVGTDGLFESIWSNPGAWVGEPSVSPDGVHLAFTVKPLESDVWVFDLPAP